MYLQQESCKKLSEKNLIFVGILKVSLKKTAGSGSGSGIRIKRHGS
jgi:hypothetical protein